MKTVIVFLSFFVFLFSVSFVKPVFATDLLINEFLPNPSSGSEWVELYNSSNSSIDLSDYYFDDDNDFNSDSGNTLKIALSGILPLLQTCYWDLSSVLNNNGDTPTLFKFAGGVATISDTYTYASSSAGLSYSRIPDGGDWSILQTPSKSSNRCTDLAPTPTLSPTPTLAPTSTPTSAPTNTPTPAPTSTPAPTPSPTSAPVSTKAPVPTSIINATTSESETLAEPQNFMSDSVLGESTENANAAGGLSIPAPETDLLSKQTKKPDPIFQGMLILLGIIFITACVVLTARIIKKGEVAQNEGE